eukprot:gene7170-18696_t
MLSMLKVLVLAACVAFVVGDAHDPCESDEAAACSVCACLLTGDCTEEQTTFCTDPVEMTVCLGFVSCDTGDVLNGIDINALVGGLGEGEADADVSSASTAGAAVAAALIAFVAVLF